MARLTPTATVLLLVFSASTHAGPLEQWDPYVAEASARFAVPPEWIRRVIGAESGGRTKLGGVAITSRAGAMGLMQLMPETWREMRARHGLGSDPHGPRDNILAGTAYLRAMYDRFGYPGMFAAYNAGPARYSSYLAGLARLPAETRAYVRKLSGDPIRTGVVTVPMARRATLFAFGPRKADDGRAAQRPANDLFAVRRSSAD